MKPIQLSSILLLFVTTFISTSCNDDDAENVIPKDNTLELLYGSWEYIDNQYNYRDIFTFNKNNTYTLEDQNLSSQDKEINLYQEGTFVYYENRYILVLYEKGGDPDDNNVLIVLEISEDKLLLVDNGHSSAITLTKKK